MSRSERLAKIDRRLNEIMNRPEESKLGAAYDLARRSARAWKRLAKQLRNSLEWEGNSYLLALENLHVARTEVERLCAENAKLREALEQAATDMDGLAVSDHVNDYTWEHLKEYSAKIDRALAASDGDGE